eukprot:1317262-Pyramimonas_sp.AAC.1
MTTGLDIKRTVATVNADRAGPLLRYLGNAGSAVVIAQELRTDDAGLRALDGNMRAKGFGGVYAPALRADKD